MRLRNQLPRFAPTRPPTHWSGVLLAQSPGPVCPQLAAEEAGRAANLTREQAALLANQAEDCLTLNIYVPHQAEGEFFTYTCIIGLQR